MNGDQGVVPGRPRALRLGRAAGLLAVLVLAPCGFSGASGRMPTAGGVLEVPASLSNGQVFDCAQASIVALSAASTSWPAVSLRDDAKGVLESGAYPADDRTGFHMRLERQAGTSQLHIVLKGAGANYVDLGVEQALKDLGTHMQRCIQAAPEAHG